MCSIANKESELDKACSCGSGKKAGECCSGDKACSCGSGKKAKECCYSGN